MRLWLRILFVPVVLLTVAAGAWVLWHWPRIERQWMSYRVGAAPSYEDAQKALAWFEQGEDRPLKLRELVRKWGTGNRQFDLYLAQYVGDAPSSDALREAFSRNLPRRDDLLPRWAHWWRWRPGPAPRERIGSILAHLDLVVAADASKRLTWREVLDLQAVFTLTGRVELAARLDPENWRERYQQWLQKRPQPLPHVVRPDGPFPGP